MLLLLFRDTGAHRGLTPLHQCYRTEWSLPSLLLGYTQANLLSLVLTCRFSSQREMDWQRIDYFLTPSAVLFQKAPFVKEPPAIREGPCPASCLPVPGRQPPAFTCRATQLQHSSRGCILAPMETWGLVLCLETNEVAVCTMFPNGFSFMSSIFPAYCRGSASESKSTKRPNGEMDQRKGSQGEVIT